MIEIDLIMIESKIEPIVKQLLQSPAIQANIEIVEKLVMSYIMEIIASESQKKGSFINKIINKIKGVLNMSDNTTVDTIVAAAVTAGETELQTEANAELATASANLASTSTNPISALILQANDKIAELESEENGNSKSEWVKVIRDPAEVIIIKTLIVAATAGSAAAIAALVSKLKK